MSLSPAFPLEGRAKRSAGASPAIPVRRNRAGGAPALQIRSTLRMTTITPPLQALMDRSAIVQAIENWGFFRDDKQWDRLRDLYTADGRMTTTWTIATADEFIHHCRGLAGKGGGRRTIHSIGATTVELNGERALAETRMTLLVRGMLDGVEVDVTNYGRTYDRFVKEQD